MYSTKSQSKKIQALLTNHLLRCGGLELLLPDGIVVQVSITKEGKHGAEICDDYCAVRTSRGGSSTLLDTYNLSLEYTDDHRSLICLDSSIDEEGRLVKRLEVV